METRQLPKPVSDPSTMAMQKHADQMQARDSDDQQFSCNVLCFPASLCRLVIREVLRRQRLDKLCSNLKVRLPAESDRDKSIVKVRIS